MAPPLPLVILLMIHRAYGQYEWGVSYSHSHICALKGSTVTISCNYTYPTGYQIMKAFWTKTNIKEKYVQPLDLSEDPEYSQRLQYLGDKQQNCTIRLSHVTQKDEHKYYFRFTTDKPDGKWIGYPGVTLTVTDLQVEAPERVTEGHNVSLTCKSSCTLTDRATFIWYRNSEPLTERRDGNNQLLLQSVRREDAGRYSCALHGHTYTSPDVQLNVTFHPGADRNVIVIAAASGGLFIIIIIILFIMKRIKRRATIQEYETDDPSANSYAALDLKSRPDDLYNTLTTVHPTVAVHQSGFSEYENLSPYRKPPQ